MIVLDASALIEALLESPRRGVAVLDRVADSDESLHAPHLLDLEVAQTLRRVRAAGQISAPRASRALERLAEFEIFRYAHELLLRRVWQLRKNVTVYDAAYLALAEVLGAPLLTCDERLARAPGHRARVELV